jgi:hypothetical protein
MKALIFKPPQEKKTNYCMALLLAERAMVRTPRQVMASPKLPETCNPPVKLCSCPTTKDLIAQKFCTIQLVVTSPVFSVICPHDEVYFNTFT